MGYQAICEGCGMASSTDLKEPPVGWLEASRYGIRRVGDPGKVLACSWACLATVATTQADREEGRPARSPA